MVATVRVAVRPDPARGPSPEPLHLNHLRPCKAVKVRMVEMVRVLPANSLGRKKRTEVYRQSNLPPGETGGGMVDVLTSRPSAQAASAPAGGRRPACRPVRRSDFRAIAGVRAGGPTPRKNRARPAPVSPAGRGPGGRPRARGGRAGGRARA